MSNPKTISSEVLCALTGLSDKDHAEISRLGFFPSAIKNEYLMAETLRGLFNYFRDRRKTAHQDEIAELVGLSSRRVQQIAAEHGIEKASRGIYDLAKVVRAILAEKDKKATPAIERLNAAKASREERKDRQEAGDVIPSAIVIRAWENVITVVKQRMLRIGNNVQSKIGLSEDQRRAVDEEAREGLRELEKKITYSAEVAEGDEEKAMEALK